MEEIIINGKTVNLKSISTDELNNLLVQINKDQKSVKMEIDNIINKLNQ